MTFEKAKFELFEREEQAIDDKNHDPDNEYLEGVADGLHEAAKLLFSVELVDVSDYIDRQAAINLVESFYKIDKSALNLMVFELKQLPPAQADVPDTNVGDTISRQAAIEAIADTLKYEDYGFLSDELESVINNVPAADVVEVVRCKDCKYCAIHTLFGRSQGLCERLCDEFDRSLARITELDDYCSRAEPKGEQE